MRFFGYGGDDRQAPAKRPGVKLSAKDRRAREAREREARDRDAQLAAAALVPPATGTVKMAISPWGQVEVDGAPSGASPPIDSSLGSAEQLIEWAEWMAKQSFEDFGLLWRRR